MSELVKTSLWVSVALLLSGSFFLGFSTVQAERRKLVAARSEQELALSRGDVLEEQLTECRSHRESVEECRAYLTMCTGLLRGVER